MSVSGEPQVAKGLQIAVADRGRVVDDLLRQLHDGDVDRVEAGGAAVEHDVADGLLEALDEHRAVGEAAVARAQPLGGRQGGQLVPPEVHPGLDRRVQRHPGRIDLGAIGERSFGVGRHSAILARPGLA